MSLRSLKLKSAMMQSTPKTSMPRIVVKQGGDDEPAAKKAKFEEQPPPLAPTTC